MLSTSLRYLMCVVRHGSIRAASAELNIAQSAVSRRLQTLEYQIGTPLFERKPRGVVLTEAGELLYAHCLASSFAIERVRSEIDELRGLRRGTVRLATIESATSSVLRDAIDRFREGYPQIVFSVIVATSDKVLEAVRQADVDFGLTLGAEFPREIEVRHRVREPLLIAMSPLHPLAQKDALCLAELAGWPVALAPMASSSRVVFERCCSRADVVMKPTLETNSVDLMRSFALGGIGVTPMLPYAALRSDGGLVAVPLKDSECAVDVSIIALRGRTLPLASERFLSVMVDQLQASSHG